ncbi:MAG: LysR family transcriptional regulator [Clostridia bacterium]|nr:LysR family transcriptional regulator [Clostridia bacterium]
MQFQQLFVFTKVVEKNSFSKAAEDIFLSQSTVSNHISNLESYFGLKLFDRLGKEIVLTPFGQKLYHWAQEILKLKEMAIWDLKDWTGKIQGKLSIAASTVPAEYMVPLLISNFRKQYPEVQFSLIQSNSEAVAEVLMKGTAELGILGEKYFPEKIDYIPFIKERLVLITPADLKLKEPVSVNALLDLPFIFRTSGSGTQATVKKILKKYGLHSSSLNIVAYFDSVQSVKQGVKAGLGVSIISEIAAADYANYNLVNSYPLDEIAEKRAFYFAYNSQITLSPLIKEFIDFSLAAKDPSID